MVGDLESVADGLRMTVGVCVGGGVRVRVRVKLCVLDVVFVSVALWICCVMDVVTVKLTSLLNESADDVMEGDADSDGDTEVVGLALDVPTGDTEYVGDKVRECRADVYDGVRDGEGDGEGESLGCGLGDSDIETEVDGVWTLVIL